jgi:hypothetical protein
MNDDEMDRTIDRLVVRARTNYRVPPAPPLDDMWNAIAGELYQEPSRRAPRGRPWWGAVMAIAAALVIGFALGRTSMPGASTGGQIAAAAAGDSSVPYERTATALLGETAVLLSALPVAARDTIPDRRFVAQAVDLLVTTRLLLDSQASHDSRLRELLEDLELVLAQIARIDKGKSGTDLELITEALTERDIVPRIRSVAAGLASTDN